MSKEMTEATAEQINIAFQHHLGAAMVQARKLLGSRAEIRMYIDVDFMAMMKIVYYVGKVDDEGIWTEVGRGLSWTEALADAKMRKGSTSA